MTKKKTPDYTRRAVDKYRAEKENLYIYLPKGAKAAIIATGEKFGAYVWALIKSDLERRGLWPPEEAQDGEEVKSEL